MITTRQLANEPGYQPTRTTINNYIRSNNDLSFDLQENVAKFIRRERQPPLYVYRLSPTRHLRPRFHFLSDLRKFTYFSTSPTLEQVIKENKYLSAVRLTLMILRSTSFCEETARRFARKTPVTGEKALSHDARYIGARQTEKSNVVELHREEHREEHCVCVYISRLARERFDGVVVPRILSLRSFVSWSIRHPSGPPTRTKGTITPALAHVGSRAFTLTLNAPLTFHVDYRLIRCQRVLISWCMVRARAPNFRNEISNDRMLFFPFALWLVCSRLFDLRSVLLFSSVLFAPLCLLHVTWRDLVIICWCVSQIRGATSKYALRFECFSLAVGSVSWAFQVSGNVWGIIFTGYSVGVDYLVNAGTMYWFLVCT